MQIRKTAGAIALGALIVMAGFLAAIRPSIGSAHTGNASISCYEVTFHYADFKAGVTNTISESVSVDGSNVYSSSFSFAGAGGSHSVQIGLTHGAHSISVSASWDTNGHQGSFHESAEVDCGGDTTETTHPETTHVETETTPTVPTPPCPGGMEPNPPGGQDGKPGNDRCKPDEPPTTTPAVTTSTTPTVPTPPVTVTNSTTTTTPETTTTTPPPPTPTSPPTPSPAPPKPPKGSSTTGGSSPPKPTPRLTGNQKKDRCVEVGDGTLNCKGVIVVPGAG